LFFTKLYQLLFYYPGVSHIPSYEYDLQIGAIWVLSDFRDDPRIIVGEALHPAIL